MYITNSSKGENLICLMKYICGIQVATVITEGVGMCIQRLWGLNLVFPFVLPDFEVLALYKSTYLPNTFPSFQGECDTNLFASGGENSFVEAAGKGDLNSMACLLDETYDEIIDQQGSVLSEFHIRMSH